MSSRGGHVNLLRTLVVYQLNVSVIQLKAGIKKAGPRGGTHRFLGFLRGPSGPTHRFLADGTTVTRRLHGRYRVSDFREGSGKGLKGGHKG